MNTDACSTVDVYSSTNFELLFCIGFPRLSTYSLRSFYPQWSEPNDPMFGEILVYARCLSCPSCPSCPSFLLYMLPFLLVSKCHLLIVVMYYFHFYFSFISSVPTVIEDGSCCKWMEWLEIHKHLCSWWGDLWGSSCQWRLGFLPANIVQGCVKGDLPTLGLEGFSGVRGRWWTRRGVRSVEGEKYSGDFCFGICFIFLYLFLHCFLRLRRSFPGSVPDYTNVENYIQSLYCIRVQSTNTEI